eukprot:5890060-Pyramimonas_sp.AAC.1
MIHNWLGKTSRYLYILTLIYGSSDRSATGLLSVYSGSGHQTISSNGSAPSSSSVWLAPAPGTPTRELGVVTEVKGEASTTAPCRTAPQMAESSARPAHCQKPSPPAK